MTMLWQTSNTTQRFPLCGEDATTWSSYSVVDRSAEKRNPGRWRG
jgi:hypothetical protein